VITLEEEDLVKEDSFESLNNWEAKEKSEEQ